MRVVRGPKNAPLEPLMGRTVAVIGLGNQGEAHALNMRESGLEVVIGARPGGPGHAQARQLGFATHSIPQAVERSELVIIALPDHVQPQVYADSISEHLQPNAVVGFLHGFNIRFGLIKPAQNMGVVLVAPKGPGSTLRARYVQGQSIPCLLAVHQDNPVGRAQAVALAWASAIGCARAGIIFTTFRDETDTDLFGEQAVLCGGMTQLILAAFDTLVAAGFPPELAYLECCHEVKQIADLVYERGLAGMMERISDTAEFGAHRAGPAIIDQTVRAKMREILTDIQSGRFAQALRADHEAGFEWFNRQRAALRAHPIEPAGLAVRALMPWLGRPDQAAGRKDSAE